MSGKNRPTNWPEDWSEDQIRAAEAPEAVPSDPDWLDEIEDAGLPPIHPSQLDPLPTVDEPLHSRWIVEHVRELVAAQEAELTGPYGAAWRRFERLLHEVARLDAERTKLAGDARDKVTRQWKEEQQEFDAFKQSSEFQAALRYRLERMQPIIERIEARPGDDPEQVMRRAQARTRRHQMEVLLLDQVTGEEAEKTNTPETPCETRLGDAQTASGSSSAERISGLLASDDHDACLIALFDAVRVEQLESMFPDGGKWKKYAERAKRNELIEARRDRAKFNPYLAARWWIWAIGPKDWKWERCLRVLANNLPARSRDSKHLLTGDYD